MSLEMIQVTSSITSQSGVPIALIKEKTGVEIIPPETGNVYKIRFPNMEKAKSLYIANNFSATGILFIDVDNHFLVFAVGNGVSFLEYVDSMYRNFIYDYNGELATIGDSYHLSWQNTNTSLASNYISEEDATKNEITLVPFRVNGAYRNEKDDKNVGVKSFVKNAYINYERRFQPGLKFIDQNGNKFVTLGGYLLYKVD